jgi:hypothetical protein
MIQNELKVFPSGVIYALHCLNNPNPCFIDSCFIDVYFVTEICELACCDGSCTWTPTTPDTGTCSCERGVPPDEDYCVGYIDYETGIPYFKIVHDRVSAGLDTTLAPPTTAQITDPITTQVQTTQPPTTAIASTQAQTTQGQTTTTTGQNQSDKSLDMQI